MAEPIPGSMEGYVEIGDAEVKAAFEKMQQRPKAPEPTMAQRMAAQNPSLPRFFRSEA